ncbi:MAG: hypothetical protein HYW08_06795 [candidate division NC10 bacterium]|nr:hypothetical protein [candidate division NC10 bacterium]MBI2562085.1 hypothetical protein [candidate division NC10 bacterium]MBI3085313.1 hypothetical protein [candidate division NC10 bacterium]
MAGAILLALLASHPIAGRAQRIFYRSQDWLATSPETQMRLLNGTLRAWEEVAEAAEARGSGGDPLSVREREALRLLECIQIRPGLTPPAVRQAIQSYAGEHPQEIFASFGDLAARALSRPCQAAEAK